MRELPILFSAPMVRAILEGRKTQTRRIVTRWHGEDGINLAFSGLSASEVAPGLWKLSSRGEGGCWNERVAAISPYGTPGDRLWVKETWTGSWHPTRQSETHIHIAYAADGGEGWRNAPCDYVLPQAAQKVGNWVSPLFMPRWASRILLEITEVRVERLLEITESDAMAEGATPWEFGPEQCLTTGERGAYSPYRSGFACLWDDINADRAAWKSNPWVWAVTFKVVQL